MFCHPCVDLTFLLKQVISISSHHLNFVSILSIFHGHKYTGNLNLLNLVNFVLFSSIFSQFVSAFVIR